MSAIPPRILEQVSVSGVGRYCEVVAVGSYRVGDHGGEQRTGGIVGVKLAHKEGDHGELNEKDDSV